MGRPKGCSYCAYAIANVFQWGITTSYHRLKRWLMKGEPSTFVRFLKGLFAQADQRRFANKITAIAQQWLRKSRRSEALLLHTATCALPMCRAK